jgi:integrase
MKLRLSKTIVDRMRPGDQLWDSDVKGFGVRCQVDVPSFFVKTRIDGRQRFMNIGKAGSPWTVETARREALRILSAAQHGIDTAKDKAAARRRATLGDVADQYKDAHFPKLKPRTKQEYDRLLDTTIRPAFGTKFLDNISRADIAKFHSGLHKTPRKANLTIAVLSSIFTWAIHHGFCEDNQINPCIGMSKFKENARERYLSTDEMTRLFAVLDDLDARRDVLPSISLAIRLLLLTGARLTEILTLKWSYVDEERATAWLPDSKTGKKAIHLSPLALELLNAHPHTDKNPFVITGTGATGHLVNLQKPWYRIRELAGLSGVRVHDLRHSYASLAINAGASLPMVGKLLGHSQPQTTMRYAHLADDPLRRLNNKIGAAIATAAGRPPKPTETETAVPSPTQTMAEE